MKVFPHEPWPCPFCNAELMAAFHGTATRQPRVGDIALCAHCGNLSLHEADGFRKPTPEETTRLNEHPGVVIALATWERMKVTEKARQMARDN